ncbi:TetR family transcriptional regulator C-terminal domain-containing protein [Streptomyces sp. 21So2-11]|uniref:TetR family transcriptional regulator C-terminal domain-containing protein n=1 Tax=Streptomyces sp. 21So2-11 TaxID=3144408 RepID=UPI003219AD1E
MPPSAAAWVPGGGGGHIREPHLCAGRGLSGHCLAQQLGHHGARGGGGQQLGPLRGDDHRAVYDLVLDGGAGRRRVQVWTETLRNEQLAATLDEGYGGLRLSWAKLVEAYRDNGLMASDVPPDQVARTLIAIAQGFIAQQALFGDVEVDVLEDRLRGLMSMQQPKIS